MQWTTLHYPKEPIINSSALGFCFPTLKTQARGTEELFSLGKAEPKPSSRGMSSLQEMLAPPAQNCSPRGAAREHKQRAGTAMDPCALSRTLPSHQHKDTSQCLTLYRTRCRAYWTLKSKRRKAQLRRGQGFADASFAEAQRPTCHTMILSRTTVSFRYTALASVIVFKH